MSGSRQARLEELADRIDASYGAITSITVSGGSDGAPKLVHAMWDDRKLIAACLREKAPALPEERDPGCWWLPCSIVAWLLGVAFGAVVLS